MVKDKVDILALTETTLDCSFVNQQFCIEGYCLPYTLHRNNHRGRAYIREDFPVEFLSKIFYLMILRGFLLN